uniref:sec1 family domain-containing protein 1 n=1 Tax=Myxine glutinosa TaxID=7769 RepID=UPI00358E54C0
MAAVREKQAGAVRRFLNMNVPVAKTASSEPVWKVLVYDRAGQDVISPLLNVRELRELGVTLHLLLHSERDAIPDVPAVYLVAPTSENVERICQDLRAHLYDSYHFNFLSAVPRGQLEEMAGAALQAGAVNRVTKVFDQHLDFVCLEDDLFVLRARHSASFHELNRANARDSDIAVATDAVADSLFCFFVTLGTVPIVRCPRGNAAEMVAEKLDKRLRENLRDARSSLFSSTSSSSDGPSSTQLSFQRPLLFLADRAVDLANPLHHSWTYQALVHDTMDLRLNRVTLPEGGPGRAEAPSARARSRARTAYDLGQNDRFWQQHKFSLFPEVADAIQQELDSYRAQEEDVKRLKGSLGFDGEDDTTMGLISDNSARLTSAVSSLPDLLEKKRLIDIHTNLATALLEQIKARKLDLYFECEEKIMAKACLEKPISEIVEDPEAGKAEDKMRLFIIYYLSNLYIPEAELEQLDQSLRLAGCDPAPFRYIRRWKSLSQKAAAPSTCGGGGTSTIGMFSRLVNTGSQFVMEGVKNLVLKKHKLPITYLLDNLMEMKNGPETENFRYFDPKLIHGNEPNISRAKTPFQEAVVMVVGGGTYTEYQNVVEYGRSKPGRRVVYGCSDLVTSEQFLAQLARLGADA